MSELHIKKQIKEKSTVIAERLIKHRPYPFTRSEIEDIGKSICSGNKWMKLRLAGYCISSVLKIDRYIAQDLIMQIYYLHKNGFRDLHVDAKTYKD